MLTPEQKKEMLERVHRAEENAYSQPQIAIRDLARVCEMLLEALGPSEHAQRVAEAMRHEKA